MVHPDAPLCPSFDYLGKVSYFITFVTHERRPLFTEAAVVGLVLEQFARASDEKQFEMLIYCFMPDHVHLVVRGLEESSDAKAFMKLAKQYSGFHYARVNDRARLWQRYGHDRIIRSEAELRNRIRYVMDNPVVAGLAQSPADYPFLGTRSTAGTVDTLRSPGRFRL
jgi:putative transposase